MPVSLASRELVRWSRQREEQGFMIATLGELTELRNEKKREPIPEQELGAMIERCCKATPGAWIVAIERGGLTIGGPVCRMDENQWMVVGTSGDWGPTSNPREDAEFIAHARSDVPRLLIELMRLRGLDAPDLDELELGLAHRS